MTAPQLFTAADPLQILWNLIVQNLSITADDGTTILTPLIGIPNSSVQVDPTRDSLIQVVLYPYKQAGSGSKPQIVVGGPQSGTSKPYASNLNIRVVMPVQVTILTRDWDGQDMDFVLSGDLTRYKIATAIRAIVKANSSNPGNTLQWLNLLTTNPGENHDLAPGVRNEWGVNQGAITLYQTMQIFSFLRYE